MQTETIETEEKEIVLVQCDMCLAKVPPDSLTEHKSLFHSDSTNEKIVLEKGTRIGQFTNKTVCIVKFNSQYLQDGIPGRFFMVTIDPGKISQSGKMIRFGENPGDEIMGWQPVDWITVVEVLGEWADNNPPTLPYKSNQGVSMLVDSNG